MSSSAVELVAVGDVARRDARLAAECGELLAQGVGAGRGGPLRLTSSRFSWPVRGEVLREDRAEAARAAGDQQRCPSRSHSGALAAMAAGTSRGA